MMKRIIMGTLFYLPNLLMAQFVPSGNNLYHLNGHVGIGVHSPTEKLEVNGDAIIRNGNTGSLKMAGLATRIFTNYNGGNGGKFEFQNWQNSSWKTNLAIEHNGNVGIGTVSPTEKLAVDGNLKILSADDRGIIFQRYNDKEPSSIKGFPGEYSTRQGLTFSTSSVGNAVNLLWNGNVGIGTISPTEKLTVDGNLKILSANDRGIIFQRYDDKEPSSIKGLPGEYSTRQGITFNTSSISNAMNILWNGNVGIGTPLPNYKLDVAGTIRACEVKVDLASGECPDYVFADNYDLMGLDDLEGFIKRNKHLPKIKPAIEMEQEGMDLKEMNIKLLEKMEEMTLYIIEINKKVKMLEADNKDLNTKMKLLVRD